MIFQKDSAAILPVRAALRATMILVMACLPVLTGCGSGKFFIPVCQETNSCGGGSGTNSSYAYVANSTANSVAVFPLPTAAFTTISGTTYPLGASPTAVAATPNGSLLYVATASGVVVYTVDTNGVITIGNGGSAVVTAFFPSSMTIDPTGNYLFVVSSQISTLLEYQINTTTGVLTALNGNGTALSSGTPRQVFVTPNGQAVAVALGSGGVDTFAFNSSNGALSNQLHLTPKTSNGVADNALGGDSKSTFLFVGETGTGIRVFTIGTGGALTEVSGSPFDPSLLGQSSIVVDPTNSYVYVASKTNSTISGYTLTSSGALTPLPSSPYSTGSGPTSLSLDSTGKYLLVICAGGSPDLQVFSFDVTTGGKLDSVATSSTASGTAGAISLSVVP